ncbi:MAG: PAS domain-containing sensor histidine kinase [Deltaproteobacteria bacterium]|nr:MAG: PAS domain-containing sensor histidine kinase [Deltaproteobacteria bacterium]
MSNILKANRLRLSIIAGLLLAVTAMHYLTTTQLVNAHDVYRRLYYVPIVLGGVWFALRGGIVTSILASLLYMPHVLFHWQHHPSIALEQYLEIVLYNVIGCLTGFLAERERQQKLRYQKTAETLEESYRKLREQADQIIEIEGQLRRADRLSALGELSAGMAHEIRNPLGSIKGTAEILRDGVAPDDPKLEFADILIKEVDRLNKVLEDFLHFARPEPVEFGRFSPNKVIEEVLELTRQQALRNRVEVEVALAEDMEIPGRGEQIQQALLNLVLNALQVMPDGGQLKVSSTVHGNEVGIHVSDNGPGIAVEERERIFNPFVTTRDSGTGLGLAITQRIIQGHDGHIHLESTPGQGSSFTLCLPVSMREMETEKS